MKNSTCKWYSVTMGNIVENFTDVVKQALESWTQFKVLDIRWKYNRNGF